MPVLFREGKGGDRLHGNLPNRFVIHHCVMRLATKAVIRVTEADAILLRDEAGAGSHIGL